MNGHNILGVILIVKTIIVLMIVVQHMMQ